METLLGSQDFFRELLTDLHVSSFKKLHMTKRLARAKSFKVVFLNPYCLKHSAPIYTSQ